ncbi:hypothetical protein K9L16_00795 [Candidatus Pacearchaeota archaeon]|nr:hypothetical protein [Candidatus Pacearchaeota archaeon]
MPKEINLDKFYVEISEIKKDMNLLERAIEEATEEGLGKGKLQIIREARPFASNLWLKYSAVHNTYGNIISLTEDINELTKKAREQGIVFNHGHFYLD